MCHHTYAAWKVPKIHADQNHSIAGGVATPSLVDTTTLTALDNVSFLFTMDMARVSQARLNVVMVTLLGQDHPTVLAVRDINADIL